MKLKLAKTNRKGKRTCPFALCNGDVAIRLAAGSNRFIVYVEIPENCTCNSLLTDVESYKVDLVAGLDEVSSDQPPELADQILAGLLKFLNDPETRAGMARRKKRWEGRVQKQALKDQTESLQRSIGELLKLGVDHEALKVIVDECLCKHVQEG